MILHIAVFFARPPEVFPFGFSTPTKVFPLGFSTPPTVLTPCGNKLSGDNAYHAKYANDDRHPDRNLTRRHRTTIRPKAHAAV
jgi:hypothetical protein